MSTRTGLFQFSPYRTDQMVPAYAEMTEDPIGQVVAVITAYLPEGTGSNGYDWDRTAYLRADLARQKVELVWTFDGQYFLEGEWEIDSSDPDLQEWLLPPGDEPDLESFAALASCAPDLAIAPPAPEIRAFWGEDYTFAEGAPAEDWPGPLADDG